MFLLHYLILIFHIIHQLFALPKTSEAKLCQESVQTGQVRTAILRQVTSRGQWAIIGLSASDEN